MTAYHIIGVLLVLAGPMVATRLRGSSVWNRAASANALALERQWQNIKRTWPVGAAIVVIFALSYYLMQRDDAAGAEDLFPLVLFMGSFFLAMGYLVYTVNAPTK